MKIPMFCISLCRARERREKIKAEWVERLGFEINFWDAYDRREIKKGIFVYEYIEERAIKAISRPMSPGEIACSTSHCMLLDHLLRCGVEEAIVLEDDVAPNVPSEKFFFNYIEKGKEEFPQADIFILHKASSFWKDNLGEIKSKKEYFSMPKIVPSGTVLLYLKKSGMTKIANRLKKMQYPADRIWQGEENQGESIVLSNLPLGIHACGAECNEEMTTYIETEHRKYKNIFIE
jgi:GR25 family glycosyltransferase involved in LPS biosynthesis